MRAPKRNDPGGEEDWGRLRAETQARLQAEEEREWAARIAQAKTTLGSDDAQAWQALRQRVDRRPRPASPSKSGEVRTSPRALPLQLAQPDTQDEEQEWQALRARAAAAEEQEWALRIARAKGQLPAPSPAAPASPPLRTMVPPRLIAIWP